jgi:hypothetical protein
MDIVQATQVVEATQEAAIETAVETIQVVETEIRQAEFTPVVPEPALPVLATIPVVPTVPTVPAEPAVPTVPLKTVEVSLYDVDSLRLQLYDVERLCNAKKLQLIKKQEECSFLSDRLKKLTSENQHLRSRAIWLGLK